MLPFGVCFILSFLKLSNISGFWGNLRRTDKEIRIIAKSYQRILRKWIKAKQAVHFLHECKSHNYILNLYAGEISKTKLQQKEIIIAIKI